MTKAATDVLAEREKQRAKWGDDHDDKDHGDAGLSAVASVLAHPLSRFQQPCGCREAMCPHVPISSVDIPSPGWANDLGAKHSRRGRLVVAAALILAEIERLDRREPK